MAMKWSKIHLFYQGAHIDFIAREPKEQVLEVVTRGIQVGHHSVSFLGQDGDYIILPLRVLQQAAIHIHDARNKDYTTS